MKGRIEKVKSIMLDSLKSMNHVDVVQLILQEDQDIYDPYFVLSFDAYYRGVIPEERKAFFPDVEMFESSPSAQKDRILYDNLPIRVEYRNLDRVETLFSSMKTDLHYPPRELSFLVHRISHGEILTERNEPFIRLMEQCQDLPAQFWKRIRQYYSSKMENYLNDLRAASLRNDPFYFQLSLGNFLRNSCALLLAVNGKTEPSPRYMDNSVNRLKILPDGFEANYNSLVRTHEELGMERKSEVAALFTRSILGLLPSY